MSVCVDKLVKCRKPQSVVEYLDKHPGKAYPARELAKLLDADEMSVRVQLSYWSKKNRIVKGYHEGVCHYSSKGKSGKPPVEVNN